MSSFLNGLMNRRLVTEITCTQIDVSYWRLTGPGLGAHGESDLSHSYFFVLLLSVFDTGSH